MLCSWVAGGVQEEGGESLWRCTHRAGKEIGEEGVQSLTQWTDPAGGLTGGLPPSGLDLNLFSLR